MFAFFPLLLVLNGGVIPGVMGGVKSSYPMPESCRSLECPSYDSIYHGDEFEIRRYKKPVWMSTYSINTTSYTDAANRGFTILFAYIQGENDAGAKIPMTAPVLINISPSTGPFCLSSYTLSFYLPKHYQKAPPLSKAVHAVRWRPRTYAAVRRFGGFMNDTNIPVEAAALHASLHRTKWDYVNRRFSAGKSKSPSSYSVAGYNAPNEYDNRVNEVMFFFDHY